MTIIGMTGTIGAGKGTAVDYFAAKGFVHYSARDFIVREIERRGLPVDRDSMVAVANELRTEHSPSYIIATLAEAARKNGNDAVIESIRTEGEVHALRENGHCYLLAIDADPKVRYERIVRRGSVTDHISFEKFLADEAREMRDPNPSKQNLARCIELADHRILNNGTREELHAALDRFMEEIAAAKGGKS